MYLYGASGHCKVIIDCIETSTNKVIEGVFDDNSKEKSILKIPIIPFKDFNLQKIKELIISVGNNSTRKKLAESIKTTYISVIHKKALVSKYAFIDLGTVVMAGVVINADVNYYFFDDGDFMLYGLGGINYGALMVKLDETGEPVLRYTHTHFDIEFGLGARMENLFGELRWDNSNTNFLLTVGIYIN